MLSLDSSIKALFREDNVHKNIVLTFSALNLAVQNEQIETESLSLTESISDGDSLEFGSCNASILKICVADVEEELTGQEFTAVIELGTGSVALGTFIVSSCEKRTDMRMKDITAYDRMSKFDVDVSTWWNSLTFDSNLTVKVFRESLCTQIGVPYVSQNLTNDSVLVEKTISVTSMTARDIIKACMEINGAFGHINRSGYFEAITLSSTSQETITVEDYSLEDIPKHSDYTVSAINKVQIKAEDEDIGGIYGTGTNALVLESNFICYGKGADALNTIASNIYNVVSGITYTTFSGNVVGLPYLEVGDRFTFPAGYSYVLSRTLSGIQALKDSITANGLEVRSEISDVNSTFERIKALTHLIKNTVEELSSIITNEETGLQTIIQQLENSISLEVVKKGEVVAAINASEEAIEILASKIDMSGLVTITSLADLENTTTINGCVITCQGTYYYVPMGETETQEFLSKTVISSGMIMSDNGKTGTEREASYLNWSGFGTGTNPNTSVSGIDLHSNIFQTLDGTSAYKGTTIYADGSVAGVMSKHNACLVAPQFEDTESGEQNPNKWVFSFHFKDGKACIDIGTRTAETGDTVFTYKTGITVDTNGHVYLSSGGNGSTSSLSVLHVSDVQDANGNSILGNSGERTNITYTDTGFTTTIDGTVTTYTCSTNSNGLYTSITNATTNKTMTITDNRT